MSRGGGATGIGNTADGGFGGNGSAGSLGVTGLFGSGHGFSPPPAGSIATWRAMRANPTIAIARLAATAPVRAADWSVETDDGVSGDVKKFLEDWRDEHRIAIVRHLVSALDYGFAAMRMRWAVVEGTAVPTHLRPLKVDDIEAVVAEDDPTTLVEAKVGEETIVASKLLWFANDPEAGDPYGRPRAENARKVWSAWEQTLARLGTYTGKTAGVVPLIEYPPGRSPDADGRQTDHLEIAQRILALLGKGSGVTMPNTLAQWAEEFARRGVDIDKLRMWRISFLETASGHGAEYVGAMRYLDSLMVRGWLVAERAITEGQSGTKAEAEAHADFVMLGAEQLVEDIVEAVNRQVVRRMLRMNYGPQFERAAMFVPAKIDRAARAWMRQLLATVIGQPANAEILYELVALDALLDQTGLPRKLGVDPESVAPIHAPPPMPGDDPFGAASAMAGAKLARLIDEKQ